MLRGTADLPLHYGSSPKWLFERMRKLARAVTEIILYEYNTNVFLERIADPYWFQCFSCVLGFDWHSSGTTTITLAALREALKESEFSEEIFVCGGKGKLGRATPEYIKKSAEKINLSEEKTSELIKASRLSAKVDNVALQDGFQLYHHSFIFTCKGDWVVVQQGMREEWARRYHWISRKDLDFVDEPHAGIASDLIVKPLNMTAKEAEGARKASVDLAKEPFFVERELKKIKNLSLPKEHFPEKDYKVNVEALKKVSQEQVKNYEDLLMVKGIGPKTVRALALLSNLIYGAELSWRDPCKYAFAHGGKDGWPYPVNKKQYDKSIKILEDAIRNARLGNKEKFYALKRLKDFIK